MLWKVVKIDKIDRVTPLLCQKSTRFLTLYALKWTKKYCFHQNVILRGNFETNSFFSIFLIQSIFIEKNRPYPRDLEKNVWFLCPKKLTKLDFKGSKS